MNFGQVSWSQSTNLVHLLAKNAIHLAAVIKDGFQNDRIINKQLTVNDKTPSNTNTKVAFHSPGRSGLTQTSGFEGDF